MRRVIQAEALSWMEANPAGPGTSVVTSLPDVSEIAGHDLGAWRAWFVGAARAVIGWADFAVFYQTDVKVDGVWIDKGYLVSRAAEEAAANVLWHKIACRKPAGTVGLGRPSYAHMIAVTRGAPIDVRHPGPDVLPSVGTMTWSRAMGVDACRVALGFLRADTPTKTVVDPFCGRGTVLAVAEEMGFEAVGVDIGAKRCRLARTLKLPPPQ